MSEPDNPPSHVSRSDVVEIVAEAVEKERMRTAAQFIGQEHRLWRVISNFRQHRSSENKQFRQAAWSALFFRLFLSGPTGFLLLGATTGAVVTAFIAALGLMAALRANALGERQNERLDVQNVLNEAQRRSTLLVSELSSIIASLPVADAKSNEEEEVSDKLVDVPTQLVPRIVALASALRPYPRVEMVTSAPPANGAPAPVDIKEPAEETTWQRRLGDRVAVMANDFFPLYADKQIYRITDQISSPERGQLLSTLILLKLNLRTLIDAGINFSYADISDLEITGDVSGLNLDNSTLDRVKIWQADGAITLQNATIDNLMIGHSTLGSDFGLTGAVFTNIDIRDGTKAQGFYESCVIKSGVVWTNVNAEELHALYGCRIEQLSVEENLARRMIEYSRTAQSGDTLYNEPDPLKLSLCKHASQKVFVVTNIGTCPVDYGFAEEPEPQSADK